MIALTADTDLAALLSDLLRLVLLAALGYGPTLMPLEDA